MKLNTVLAPLTVVMCVITAVTVFNHMNQQRSESPSSSAATATGMSSPMIPSSERSLLSPTRRLLVTGVSSKIPEADDYRLISTIPWEHKDVSRLFRDAGTEMSCELLETGSSVVQSLVAPTADVAGPLGRLSAFSIRLQVGKTLGDGLQSMSNLNALPISAVTSASSMNCSIALPPAAPTFATIAVSILFGSCSKLPNTPTSMQK